MRLALLTTRTLHHAWFLRELNADYPVGLVLEESSAVSPPFAVAHPFEAERDEYERQRWFTEQSEESVWGTTHLRFASINEPEAVAQLRSFMPDIAVVFGTGRLSPEVITACPPGGLVNLHGGDPERYRGLDTHLWAIYHGDVNGLVTTLHVADRTLDTGAIVGKLPIPITTGMRLHQLRAANTEICLTLVRRACADYQRSGQILGKPQSKLGRYYSFMPTCLKEVCLAKFERLAGLS